MLEVNSPRGEGAGGVKQVYIFLLKLCFNASRDVYEYYIYIFICLSKQKSQEKTQNVKIIGIYISISFNRQSKYTQ